MSTDTFGALGVPAPLVSALTANGITTPFPIQVDTLPDTLNGRDVLGRGKTGSGKTLAYLLPAVVHINAQPYLGARRQLHARASSAVPAAAEAAAQPAR